MNSNADSLSQNSVETQVQETGFEQRALPIMAGDLFHDLPPPSAPQSQQIALSPVTTALKSNPKPTAPPAPLAPALKSALKRPKSQPESQSEGTSD